MDIKNEQTEVLLKLVKASQEQPKEMNIIINEAYHKNIFTGEIVYINCGVNRKVTEFLRSTLSN